MSLLDENRVYVLLGQNPSGEAVPVKVSSSGELVIEYVVNGILSANQVPRNDDNYVPVSKAESSSVAVSLLTDSNGYVILTGVTIS